jgi:hypothetical protein
LVFSELGGFDESYPVPAVEDIEFGSRMRRAGLRIRLEKTLQVKHLKIWRVGNMLATDLLRRAAPWTELMLRDGGLVNDLNVKTSDRLSVILAVILAASIPVALMWPPAFVMVATCFVPLVVMNSDLYRFYARTRGPVFSLAAIFWHWVYLLVCAAGFKLGVIRFLVGRVLP